MYLPQTHHLTYSEIKMIEINSNKKAQLSLTNPRDTKACPVYCNCSPLAQERLAISTKSIHRWKPHLVGYNSVADSTALYGSISIRLAVVAFQMYKIVRNSKKIKLIAVQGHPRSSTLVPIESS